MCRVHVDIVHGMSLDLNTILSNQFSLECDKQTIQLVGGQTENGTAVGCEKIKCNPENPVSICLL